MPNKTIKVMSLIFITLASTFLIIGTLTNSPEPHRATATPSVDTNEPRANEKLDTAQSMPSTGHLVEQGDDYLIYSMDNGQTCEFDYTSVDDITGVTPKVTCN